MGRHWREIKNELNTPIHRRLKAKLRTKLHVAREFVKELERARSRGKGN